MLKLYYAPGACSFVPHAALEAARAATGEDFETQVVRLHKGEQKAPEYIALNPNGQVPVLLIDGQPLTQITAIADYLDERYPQLELIPAAAAERRAAKSLIAWMNNSVHTTFTHIFMPGKFTDSETAQAEIKRYNLGLYRGHLERIQALTEKASPWLFGAKSGVADIYALVLFRWGGLGGIDPDTLPAYKAFVERLAQEPAIAAALAKEGAPLNMYKKPA